MYVYLLSEKACRDNDWHDLWTVGFYSPDGKWYSESDHNSIASASKRVAFLNGRDETDLEEEDV